MKLPNIVYIVCHDLGRHLPVYGVPSEAPNLSRLAAEGIVFTNAFCNSPACSPSRACAMTGRYAHETGAIGLAHMGWELDPAAKTIVDYLNEAGYETAHYGMNHERRPGKNHYRIDEEEKSDHGRADLAVDGAIEYLRHRRDRSRPFYLNIGTGEVHNSRWKKHIGLYGGVVPADDVAIPLPMAETPELRASYAYLHAAIRFLDKQIGRLLDALDDADLRKNTIVVFTTDHGIPHNRGKGTLYDAGVGITLLVRLPDGMSNGVRHDCLIQNIDFVPTLLDASSVPIPEGISGRSFWPLLTGGSYQPHTEIFLERNFHGERPDPRAEGGARFVDLYDPVRSVRTPEFTLIENFGTTSRWVRRHWLPWEIEKSPDWGEPSDPYSLVPLSTERRPGIELFRNAEDPHELIDLAHRPEWRRVREDLESRLRTWMRRTGDFALSGEVPVRPCDPW